MKVKVKYPEIPGAYCGKLFKRKHNRQKYCSKECSKNAHQEQKNEYWKKWFYKNKDKLYAKQLGTRTIGPHKHPINEREQQIVQNEKQRTLNQVSNCLDYNMKVW